MMKVSLLSKSTWKPFVAILTLVLFTGVFSGKLSAQTFLNNEQAVNVLSPELKALYSQKESALKSFTPTQLQTYKIKSAVYSATLKALAGGMGAQLAIDYAIQHPNSASNKFGGSEVVTLTRTEQDYWRSQLIDLLSN